MHATGVKHWSARSGGKVISGLFIGAGILLMVLTTFLHKSTLGFVLGLLILAVGITGALKAFLDNEANRQEKGP